jgi:plastocyanin
MIYVMTKDLDPGGRLSADAPREPLVIRAAAGDCIEITLRNALPPGALNIGTTDGTTGIELTTSHQVGLHPQLVSYDITQSNGVNIGINPTQSIGVGEVKKYKWYAGSRTQDEAGNTVFTPVEFGSVSLSPADPLRQHPYGLVGAMVIEPEGSTWKTDDNSRTSANVYSADGALLFREFVTVVQDDLARLATENIPAGHVQLAGGPSSSDQASATNPATIQIEATADGGLRWIVDGQDNPNGGTVPINKGDTLEFSIKDGFHGLTFLDKVQAQQAFTINSGTFVDQPAVGPNAWGTAGQPSGEIASITVKEDAPDGTYAFECTVHKTAMAGVLKISGGQAVIQIEAAAAGGLRWIVDGQNNPDGGTIPIKNGDTLEFSIKDGFHGLTFLDKAQAEEVFDFVSSTNPFKHQPTDGSGAPFPSTSWGTDGQSSGAIATLKVKSDNEHASVPFECTVHGEKMKGVFTIGAPGPTTPLGGVLSRAINYRTEPLGYRFVAGNWEENIPAKAPLGISRAVSNTLVLADPQTPVFAASKGTPVRFRMVHPAGTNEETWTLHGHVWQEEPYTDRSTKIGNNPLSQWLGSRDAFGPNNQFDIVLNSAGGKAEVAGDYLYRSFIETDFFAGLWGLFRVGEPNADIVTVTKLQNAPEPDVGVIVQGVNTVNPNNGQMAKAVKVTDASGSLAVNVPVDPHDGTWRVMAPGVKLEDPVRVTVESSQGGKTIATSPIVAPFPVGKGVVVPFSPDKNVSERLRFLPQGRFEGEGENAKSE